MIRRVLHDIAEAVVAHGVDTVYGVLGDGNLHLALALEDVGVRWVSARHEQAAVAMADGAARRTGRLAAASVTHGPGLTNAMTALTAAALARTPLLLLLGDTPRTTRHHGQDVPQEPYVRAAGVTWVPLRLAATGAEDVGVAVRAALGRRVPAALNLPVDLQMSPSAGGKVPPVTVPLPARPAPSAHEVTEVLALLDAAERPLLLAGRGALDCRDDVLAVAERTGALVGTTLLARGLFGGHASDVGLVGGFASTEARSTLAEVDLVVALGASLNRFTTASGKVCPQARWVQVERDPSEVGDTTVPDLVVVADTGMTAAALAQAVLERPAQPVVAGLPAPTPPGAPTGGASTGLDPREVLTAVDASLPDRRGLVVGIGHYSGLAALSVRVADPRDQVLPWQLGSVGLALAVGLGAAAVRPDRPTLVVEGDGGLLMNPGELDTLARLDLPVLVLVLDDGAYGAEVHLLRRTGHDDAIARFPRRDLAGVARSLGVQSAAATTADELRSALGMLLPVTGPRLLHAHVDLEVVHDEVFTALSG